MRRRTDDVREQGFTDLVLVCTTDRDADYACCADVDADAVFAAVEEWLRERDVFWSHVRLGRSSCLGLCSADGVAVVVQPRSEWFSDVRPAEVPDLLADVFGSDADELQRR